MKCDRIDVGDPLTDGRNIRKPSFEMAIRCIWYIYFQLTGKPWAATNNSVQNRKKCKKHCEKTKVCSEHGCALLQLQRRSCWHTLPAIYFSSAILKIPKLHPDLFQRIKQQSLDPSCTLGDWWLKTILLFFSVFAYRKAPTEPLCWHCSTDLFGPGFQQGGVSGASFYSEALHQDTPTSRPIPICDSM